MISSTDSLKVVVREWKAKEPQNKQFLIDGGSAKDVKFLVRIVCQNERYGVDGSIVHLNDDPLVEFYDTRHTTKRSPSYAGEPTCQFVTRYYLTSLVLGEMNCVRGLLLDTGCDSWVIPPDSMHYLRLKLTYPEKFVV